MFASLYKMTFKKLFHTGCPLMNPCRFSEPFFPPFHLRIRRVQGVLFDCQTDLKQKGVECGPNSRPARAHSLLFTRRLSRRQYFRREVKGAPSWLDGNHFRLRDEVAAHRTGTRQLHSSESAAPVQS